MKTNQKIELINASLKEYPELVNLFYDLLVIKSGYWPDFSKICELAEIDNNKIDSAYPHEYGNKMRELYPGFINGNYCFDYTNNRFGEMLNINDKLIQAIFKPLE